MPRLDQIEPETATGAAADLLNQVQQTLGVTPNMTKVMASSPALLEGYLALAGALGGGVIPGPVRERLAVATAEANGCAYCLSAHTYIGANIAKIDAAELDRARSAESNDPHTAALLSAVRRHPAESRGRRRRDHRGGACGRRHRRGDRRGRRAHRPERPHELLQRALAGRQRLAGRRPSQPRSLRALPAQRPEGARRPRSP